jgi:hypothetical protein
MREFRTSGSVRGRKERSFRSTRPSGTAARRAQCSARGRGIHLQSQIASSEMGTVIHFAPIEVTMAWFSSPNSIQHTSRGTAIGQQSVGSDSGLYPHRSSVTSSCSRMGTTSEYAVGFSKRKKARRSECRAILAQDPPDRDVIDRR